MTRLFWSFVLIAILVGGGWTLYAGAQEYVAQVDKIDAAADPRYQFIEHYYVQPNGVGDEIFLRFDRETGQAWRFHAAFPTWTPIGEASGQVLPSEAGINRYDLKSHEYRDSRGQKQELFLRVDYVAGDSWKYRGMAPSWEQVPLTVETRTASEPDEKSDAAAEAAPTNR